MWKGKCFWGFRDLVKTGFMGDKGSAHLRTACQWVRNHSSLRQFDNAVRYCQSQFELFGVLLVRNMGAISANRASRLVHLLSFYNRLYNKSLAQKLARRFIHNAKKHRKNPRLLLGTAALFNWKVSDEEMESAIDDLHHIEHLRHPNTTNGNGNLDGSHNGSALNGNVNTDGSCKEGNSSGNMNGSNNGSTENCNVKNANGSCEDDDSHYMDEWTVVLEKDNFKMWRRPIPDTELYEYKVFGSYTDIPAQAFFHVQIDLEYRKQWDNMVIKLEKVDKDEETKSEVVQWITHYPYPMYAREYVYTRRYKVDIENNVMVLIARAVDHPDTPVKKDYVRVDKYQSKMVIHPHRNFNENGFDYVLTYFDDPQATIPSMAYKWMAKKGVPDFLDKLHDVAKTLKSKSNTTSQVQDNMGSLSAYTPSTLQSCT